MSWQNGDWIPRSDIREFGSVEDGWLEFEGAKAGEWLATDAPAEVEP